MPMDLPGSAALFAQAGARLAFDPETLADLVALIERMLAELDTELATLAEPSLGPATREGCPPPEPPRMMHRP